MEIGPAQVHQFGRMATGIPAHQISGAVHALTGGSEGVGHEAIRGQIGPAMIAAGELGAREIQLAGHPGQGRSQPGIQDVYAAVPFRIADRHNGAVHFPGDVAVGDTHRRLGWAVQIVQACGTHRAKGPDGFGGQCLTDREYGAQCVEIGTHSGGFGMSGERTQHRGHEIGDGYAVFADGLGEVAGIAVALRSGQHQPRADAQRQKVTPQRDIEGGCRLLQVHIIRGEPVLRLHPGRLVDDRGVRNTDALGFSG